MDSAHMEKAAYESNGKAANVNISLVILRPMLKNLFLGLDSPVVTSI